MLIILSQKIDMESTYFDELFVSYHYPARYKNQIHEGDTFVYYQGNRHAQEQRYYFGTGRVGKITKADEENYYAELLDVKRFEHNVPIYLSEERYIEELGYETIRNSERPPWQSSVRPLSQSAYDCIISRAGQLLETGAIESVEELKEKLKGAIRRFYFGEDSAIRDIVDITSGIKSRLCPDESRDSDEKAASFREADALVTPDEESFAEYCRTTKMTYSYKMLLILSFIQNADEQGNLEIEKAVGYFREYFNKRRAKGLMIERKPCIYQNPAVTDKQIRNNLIVNPVKAVVSGGFFDWSSETGVLLMKPDVWATQTSEAKEEIIRICEQRLKDYFQDG